MKFTLSWLKEHLDTNADLDTIVKTLTKIGLEVEEVINPAENLKGFITAILYSLSFPDKICRRKISHCGI